MTFRGQQAAATLKPRAPVTMHFLDILPRPTGRGHIEAKSPAPVVARGPFRGQQAAATLKPATLRGVDAAYPSAANRPSGHIEAGAPAEVARGRASSRFTWRNGTGFNRGCAGRAGENVAMAREIIEFLRAARSTCSRWVTRATAVAPGTLPGQAAPRTDREVDGRRGRLAANRSLEVVIDYLQPV